MTHKILTRNNILAIAAITLLTGCSSVGDLFSGDDEKKFEGERVSVLELEKELEPDDRALKEQGLLAPAPWENSFWPQAGGYPNHAMQHLALAKDLNKLWSTDVGQGGTDRIPLTAQPILIENVLYALDAGNNLSALDAGNGKKLWQLDISKPTEDESVISGGISYAQGLIYATNGFNEVLAIEPKEGKILWRKKIEAPSRAAPTVLNGRVFVLTLNNRLIALNAQNGNLLWEHEGFTEGTNIIGAASPAATNDIVIAAFSSGEIAALRVENGSIAWTDNIAGITRLGGMAGITDIRALPVIDKGIVFAISFSGRMLAIDARTGNRIWQREISSTNTPWVAGNHIFVLTSSNEIVALGRETGSIHWVKPLTGEEINQDFIFHGPLFAGQRLILAGTNGLVIEMNPETGDIIKTWDAGASVAVSPIIADGTLYLLKEDGTLTAYR